MSTSTRPRTHAERDTIVRRLASHLAGPSPDATVAEMHSRLFATASDAYVSAREAWVAAHGAWQTASATAKAADEDFDAALRRVMLSLRDDHDGRSDPTLNQSLLGGLRPSELIAMAYAEEIPRARAFLTRLAARTDLSPNPDRVEKLRTALDTLDAAASALDAALGARLAASSAQDAASAAFDTAWGDLVRTLKALAAPGVVEALLPRFNRGGADTAPTDEAGPGDALIEG